MADPKQDPKQDPKPDTATGGAPKSYVANTAVKVGGKRYEAGKPIPAKVLDDDAVEQLRASGALASPEK